MCEFSQRLVAWLDGELSDGAAAEMERHVRECGQCRGRLDAYRQVSEAFDGYCNAQGNATLSAKPGRISTGSARAVSGAAAIAAIAGAFFLLAGHLRQSPLRTSAAMSRSAGASPSIQTAAEQPARQSTAPAPLRSTTRLERGKGAEHMSHALPGRRLEAPQPEEDTNPFPGAPAIEIAIPGDAIFPPGAAPPGVSFTADVMIAPDGSAQQIRLRPQLTQFERRGAQR